VAHIDVLTGRPIGPVDRRIFGSVTEHLGRCVDGGVFEAGSPGGFRADVLAAVRDLGVTNVRWPLGAAPGAEEPGRFGTGEFLSWCAIAAVEPVLGFNMDTGTLDEALAWLEYCNGSGDSHWARRRRADGHAQPFGVRYWGLGHQVHRRRIAATSVRRCSLACTVCFDREAEPIHIEAERGLDARDMKYGAGEPVGHGVDATTRPVSVETARDPL